MVVSSLHKSLVAIIAVGALLCTFTFVAIHPSSYPPRGVGYGGGVTDDFGFMSSRFISIRVDDVVLHNISDKVLENLRNEKLLCSNARVASSLSAVDKLPTIYFVTPTYRRPEQIPDMTRLSQTLMHVPSIMWLVIEDAESLTPQVGALLRRSGVPYIHLIAPMPKSEQKKKVKARGVSNRNRALQWIRENYVDPAGVVYFADDDNSYDLRIFDEIRSVKKVGMWPVGLITSTGVSSPIVKNGKVIGFYDGWIANRKFPVDMAGFAFSVDLLLKRPKASMPFTPGYEEDKFLQSLGITKDEIEPKAANCTEIYVWHTQTKKNKAPVKTNGTFTDTNILILNQIIGAT